MRSCFRICSLSTSIIILLSCAVPVRSAEQAGAAVLEAEPAEWRVGPVLAGRELSKRFRISFQPPAPGAVALARAWSTCECIEIAASLPTGASKSAWLEVTFRAEEKIGPFSGFVVASTERPHASVVKIPISAVILPPKPEHVEVFFSRDNPEGVRIRNMAEKLASASPAGPKLLLLPIDEVRNYRLLRRREQALSLPGSANVLCVIDQQVALESADDITTALRLYYGRPVPEVEASGRTETGLTAAPVPPERAAAPVTSRLPGQAAGPSSAPRRLQVRVLYSSLCAKCVRILSPLSARLNERYGDRIDFAKHNTSATPEAFLVGESFFAAYGIANPRSAVLFAGDRFLNGTDEIAEKAEKLIASQLAAGEEHYALLAPPGTGAPEAAVPEEVPVHRRMNVLAVCLAALADGVNPCAFATMVLLVSILSVVGGSRREMLGAGAAFCAGAFVTYYAAGAALFGGAAALQALPRARAVVNFTAVLCLAVFGLLSLADAVRYHRHRKPSAVLLRIPERVKQTIAAVIRSKLGTYGMPAGGFAAGAVVAVLEGICTGQMYLPTLVFMARTPELRARGYTYLLLYNLLFIAPLIGVLLAASYGLHFRRLSNLLKSHVVSGKVLLACAFFLLAALMIAAG